MTDKVVLSPVSSFVNDTTAVSTVNNNMVAITTAMDNTLSRDGTSPNMMNATLDMNSNQIINLPSPGTMNSPARLVDVASNPTITVPPVGTSGGVVGLLSGNNTYSGVSTFTGNVINNNSNNQLLFTNSNDLSTVGTFGTPFVQLISNTNTLITQAIQNTTSNNFPAGVTAYGKLFAAVGNNVYGVYGRADAALASTGTACNEFDINNNSGADAPSTFPINNPFGTTSVWPVGLFIAPGGANLNYAGLYITPDPSAPGGPGKVRRAIYIDKAVCTDMAICIDASASVSPTNSLVVRHTGLSTNVPVIFQTLGTYTKANVVLAIQDLSGNIVTRITQNGGIVSTISPSATSGDSLFHTLNNTIGGSGASAAFRATTDAGTFTMAAGSTADGSANSFTWTGAGTTFINCLNATGNFSVRTGAGPTLALAIDASQVIQFGAASTVANGSKAIVFTASVGPNAAVGTAIAKWLTFKDSAGTVSYIPMWQ